MTIYRDLLCERFNTEIGSVVGCGLDRLDREVSNYEINTAIEFYSQYKEKLNELPIGGRREAIAEFISNNLQVPSYLKK